MSELEFLNGVDEVAWYVNKIDNNGLIRIKKNGGADHLIMPSMKVNIHNFSENRTIVGVVGIIPIHKRKSDFSITEDGLYVDIGLSSKREVEKTGVSIGDSITIECNSIFLNNNVLCGKAFDNKIGGLILTKIDKIFQDYKLPYNLQFANCVQEEVGKHGAKMVAKKYKPNIAIVLDVCHDTTTPNFDKGTYDISIGKGPVFTIAPPVHNILLNMIKDLSKDIPSQTKIGQKITGTDADIVFDECMSPTCLISIPMRYMHTTVETINTKDVENTVKVIANFLKWIKPETKFNYINL